MQAGVGGAPTERGQEFWSSPELFWEPGPRQSWPHTELAAHKTGQSLGQLIYKHWGADNGMDSSKGGLPKTIWESGILTSRAGHSRVPNPGFL